MLLETVLKTADGNETIVMWWRAGVWLESLVLVDPSDRVIVFIDG